MVLLSLLTWEILFVFMFVVYTMIFYNPFAYITAADYYFFFFFLYGLKRNIPLLKTVYSAFHFL